MNGRRTLFALAIFSIVPGLAACPKKETPPPPPEAAPPPVEEASTTNLVPIEEDAGMEDADAGATKPKYNGPAVNTNVARLKQCCNALRTQAKQQGNPPEFAAAIQSCDNMVSSLGPNGNAPELGALKGLLAGKSIPPVCAGF